MIFTITLGDWSDDGHGKTEIYRIQSNKFLPEVREAYFRAQKKFPQLDPAKYCCKYQDYTIPEDILKELKEKGCDVSAHNNQYCDTSSFIMIVVWFICQGDPNLTLSVLAPEEDFHFHGFDSKKRQIDFFGYGLFS